MSVERNPISVSARSSRAELLTRATLMTTLSLLAPILVACGQKGPLTLTPKVPASASSNKAAPAAADAASRPAREIRAPSP